MELDVQEALRRIDVLLCEQPGKALEACTDLLSYCNGQPDSSDKLNIYIRYCKASLLCGSFQDILPYLTQSLSFAEAGHDNESISCIYDMYAQLFFRMNNYPIAQEYLTKALSHVDSGNVLLKASIQNNMGSVFSAVEDYESALFHFMSADEADKISGYTYLRAAAASNVAECLLHMGEYEKSIAQAFHAISVMTSHNYRLDLHKSYKIIANAYEKLGKDEDAAIHYQKAFESIRAGSHTVDLQDTYEHYIDFLLNKKEYEQAELQIQEYLSYCRQLSWYRYTADAYAKAITLYLRTNRSDKLYEYLKYYHDYMAVYQADYIQESSQHIELRIELDALKQNHNVLKRLSEKDPMTGVGNRYRMEDNCNRILAHLAVKDENVGAFMIDIDHFKHINDTKGHIFGDQCIISVAGYLKNLAKPKRYHVYRFGGDEFFMLIESPCEDEMKRLGDTILKSLNAQCGCTVSVGGIMLKAGKCSDVYALIRKVDRVLYEAKKTRNTFRIKLS